MCIADADHVREESFSGEDKMAASRSSSERMGGMESVEYVGKDEEDGEGCLPQMGDGFTRTNTEITLVDGDEESAEVALKALKFAAIDDG